MSSEQHEHNAFIRWKHTPTGRLVWTVLTGIIAYVFVSLAIDSGQLWQWGVAVLFTIDALYNFAQFVRKLITNGTNGHTN